MTINSRDKKIFISWLVKQQECFKKTKEESEKMKKNKFSKLELILNIKVNCFN